MFAAECSTPFCYAAYSIWVFLNDPPQLKRAMSVCGINWAVSETHIELAGMSSGTYTAEKDGQTVFFNTPKTWRAYAKGLIATRLHHQVERAKVSAFIPAAESQFFDVMLYMGGSGDPLSLLCSLCARWDGGARSAEAYARAELSHNLSPLKQVLAHLTVAVNC